MIVARIVLNYKSIPYITSWTEYPDIAPTLSALGIQPNPSSTAPWPYTAPAIRLTSGEHVMGSLAIATRLEELYPNPPLHLDSSYLVRVNEIIAKVSEILMLVHLTGTQGLLRSRSADYFAADREKMLGMPIEQYSYKKIGRHVFEEVAPHVQEMAKMLRDNESGPWFLGENVGYADLVVVSWMRYWSEIGVLKDVVRSGSEVETLRALYAAAAPLLERDAY